MRRIKAALSLLIVGWIGCSCASAFAQKSTNELAQDGVTGARHARTADLIQIWYYARMFDPLVANRDRDWDAALVAAAPAAIEAPDDQSFAQAIDGMLANVGGSALLGTPPNAATDIATRPTPAFRVDGGAAIATCTGMAKLDTSAALEGAMAATIAAVRSRGVVIDCREFTSDSGSFPQVKRVLDWIAAAAVARLGHPITAGGSLVRFHDGYPPDIGSTSGNYSQGTATLTFSPITALALSVKPAAIVLLIDPSGAPDWDLVAGAQAAGALRVVVAGAGDERGAERLTFRHADVVIPVAQYVRPDGATGFQPDACVAAGRSLQALTVAIRLLDRAASGPACAVVPRTSSSTPILPFGPPASPSIGERVLALAKLWGAIKYFYPYQALLDRPWDAELETAVSSFLAADSRAAYEEAVQQLAHAIPDSHTWVSGQTDSVMGQSHGKVPLFIRSIGDVYIVVDILDPSLAGRIAVGDELLAVDGRAVRDVAATYAARVSASTPQALADVTDYLIAAGPKGSVAHLTLRHATGPAYQIAVPRSFEGDPEMGVAATPIWRRLEPDIGYIDLKRLPAADADRALDDLMTTRAIVFDLRGYPQGTAWVIGPRLARPGRDGAVAALFRRPRYLGAGSPGEAYTSFEQHLPLTTKSHYAGKVIVLIDARAISQSEHTAMFFAAATDPIFVGSPTAGADGDVTNISLPGGLSVSFTGHDVRRADGRQLQRVGIQPDVLVKPTVAGIRAGRDEVLDAGLKVARAE